MLVPTQRNSHALTQIIGILHNDWLLTYFPFHTAHPINIANSFPELQQTNYTFLMPSCHGHNQQKFLSSP